MSCGFCIYNPAVLARGERFWSDLGDLFPYIDGERFLVLQNLPDHRGG